MLNFLKLSICGTMFYSFIHKLYKNYTPNSSFTLISFNIPFQKLCNKVNSRS